VENLAILILAAGKGKRMKSSLPKVLHPILGEPMIYYVLEACSPLPAERWIVVLGHKAEEVKRYIPNWVEVVYQEKPLGTGDAVKSAEKALSDFHGSVMVICGDTPLITSETLLSFWEKHKSNDSLCTFLVAGMSSPEGYGRIIRDEKGRVERIVEESDATEEEKKIREVNAGFYIFEKNFLFDSLKKLKPTNAQNEYYLTDILHLAFEEGIEVSTFKIDKEEEILGVNSRIELAEAAGILKRRINEGWMREGVSILDPNLTYIGPKVVIGKNTVILPMTTILGKTVVGKECKIGPCTDLFNVEVGDSTSISYTVAEECRVGGKAQVGPFVRLREGTEVSEGAKVGTFVEVKKSFIGKGSKVPHLSYIGDAVIGENVNVGAGSITCNYDGVKKHRTVIEDEAFIGSDTMLVAPVKIGRGAFTGAGSAITQDVPPHSLAVERSEQRTVKDWAKKKKKKGGGKVGR
jgi:bifunctional UDP-N-acetylglucosamine pyrophosphorylase/glucosamine-1-phosphate N-acetyltransferase